MKNEDVDGYQFKNTFFFMLIIESSCDITMWLNTSAK